MKDKVDELVSQNLTVSLVSVSKNFGESRNNLFSVYIYGFGSNRRLSIAYTIEQDDYTTATWSRTIHLAWTGGGRSRTRSHLALASESQLNDRPGSRNKPSRPFP